jgi:hypothetical protein
MGTFETIAVVAAVYAVVFIAHRVTRRSAAAISE